jgi:3',5'-cyclic AMP phosphodiesterase CpdA
MRLRVFSDLHLEFQSWTPPAAEADAIVLAGDIHVGTDGLTWARATFPALPIVYVPGNHEYYGYELDAHLRAMRTVARSLDIHLLDGDAAVIGNARFLGATLWTDFALYGAADHEVARAMTIAQQAMVDYRAIRGHGRLLLRPQDTREQHIAQRGWLATALSKRFDGLTIVVTHHLPHPSSIHARYVGDVLNPAFASDLSALVRHPATLWIHGHTHESMDYAVHGTRVRCNPRGYLPHEPNPHFDPIGIVDVAPHVGQ